MNKALRITLLALCGIAAVYFGFCGFFRNHFSLFTYVNGVNISGLTAQAAENKLYESGRSYNLELTGRNGVTDSISGAEISLRQVPQVMLDGLLEERSPFAWPLSLVDHLKFSVPVRASYSRDQLEMAVGGLVFFDSDVSRRPKDAQLKFVDGLYVPEADYGSRVIKDKLLAAVEDAITGMDASLDLDEAGCYEEPAVTEEDPELIRQSMALNEYSDLNISIAFGEDEYNLTAANLMKFTDYEDGEITVNEGQVAEYVNALADKYDTKGKPHEFKTTSGKTISLDAGTYGWEMDRNATTKLITEALSEGGRSELEPVFKQTARSFINGDIGDTYVECDLDEQHVYVYVDGELAVETDCVSGKAISGSQTPNGIYAIYSKQRNTVLVGEGYRSPVSYWMPFYRNYGLHDANWRSRFGSTYYVNGGSHGCVNLPVSIAGEVYDAVEVGTPVIVFGGMTREEAYAFNNGGKMPENTADTSTSSKTTTTTASAPAASSITPEQALANAMAAVDAATAAAAQAQQVMDAATAMYKADPNSLEAQTAYAVAQAQLNQANANLGAANEAAVQAALAAQAALGTQE